MDIQIVTLNHEEVMNLKNNNNKVDKDTPLVNRKN